MDKGGRKGIEDVSYSTDDQFNLYFVLMRQKYLNSWVKISCYPQMVSVLPKKKGEIMKIIVMALLKFHQWHQLSMNGS